ncbi:MAG TPA: glycogen debranching N-terminal domain-containing protein, partial [Candidatus Obscuribacter sp.]|nr:glycogen debranching N-terminal domain-containing protein [Candidatus Obscuribacter sp.]
MGDALYERITLENFHSEEVEFDLTISLQSDFADMFEVRGLNLSQRGERMVPLSGKDGRCLSLAYKGLDGLLQETVIDIDASGAQRASLQDGRFTIRFRLPVRQSRSISLKLLTRLNGKTAPVSHDEVDYVSALKLATNRYLNWCKSVVDIQTCQELFDVSLNRSLKDIYILRQPTPKGIGLAAGIPWYCAVFGRDSAITALQLLPFAPELARETIEVLAAYQGQKDDLYKAEHPGRIMHELRLGELARRAEIPHSPYYGTVDATQLWLILYGQYVSWSGDIEFARRLWGSVYLALDWLDKASGSGYITYQRESPHGLENQGWKDSGDSVMH